MLRTTALAVIGVCAIACSSNAATPTSAEEAAARDAALQWLQLVDSGNYKDAAAQMAEQVRGSRDWANYLASHRAPLSRVNKRTIAEVKHASTFPGDPEVRPHAMMRFKTSFKEKADATEEIVLTKMGCCWEVSGYSITAVTR